jgi:hypothetical protein
MNSQYFYFEGNTQKGPVSLDELLKNITAETEIWTQGMTDWAKAGTVPEIAALLSTTTPQNGTPSGNGTQTIPASAGYKTEYTANSQQPEFQTLLIWAIISTFLCCNITGVVGIVLDLKAEIEWTKGNFDKAHEKFRNAKTWTIIGAVLAVIFYIVYFSCFAVIQTKLLENLQVQ